MTPEYLKDLDDGNVGVGLGAVSGGLVVVDVDLPRLVESYLSLNPAWRDTLQTQGRPGRRGFWLQTRGGYPARTIKLKTHSGEEAGEWRAGRNCQSIIHGTHPDTGKPYEMLCKAKPLAVNFADIIPPAEIANWPTLETHLPTNETERQSYGVTELQSYRCYSKLCLSVTLSLCIIN